MNKQRILICFSLIVFLSCSNYKVTPNFSKEYIAEFSEKNTIEIPKILELFHIILSLTEIGQKDPYMLHKESEYHKKVVAYFDTHKNESIVKKFNSKLKGSPHSYHKFVKFFYNYNLDNNVISVKNNYTVNSSYTRYLKAFESFAQRVDFEKFYNEHTKYYTKIIDTQHSLVQVDKIKKWLEKEFSTRYQCYKTIFSPLTGNNHSTVRFEQEGYREMLLFVSTPTLDSRRNKNAIYKGQLTGVLFTEINHNYVNPVSDTYSVAIAKALQKRPLWVHENSVTKNYASAYSVFNEYLTHALFCFYIAQNYKPADSKVIVDKWSTFMEAQRGFYQFSKFVAFIYDLKSNHKKRTFEELYPEIIAWFSDVAAPVSQEH